MSTNPFDWLNSINDTKKDLTKDDPNAIKGYNPYMVVTGLSYFPDTLFYANEMNRNASFLDKKLQYDFLLNSVTRRKRFSKWAKFEEPENVALVKEYYNVSGRKAREMLEILTAEQIQSIKEKLFKGGK